MATLHTSHSSRRRRWLVGVVLLGLFLAAYAFALSWFTRQVQQGVQQSLRDIPVGVNDKAPGN